MDLNWTAKIYMGSGTLGPSDLLTVGKIHKISGNMNSEQGAFRLFEGKNQGEILERRLKTNRRYEDLDASTIVTVDIAEELGIWSLPHAYKIATDTTDETVTIRTEPFIDYLRKCSDYWYSGAVSVQKDWLVDTEGELVWKARPLRKATTNVAGTADAGGDATHTVDAERTEANDYWNGCSITFTSGTNSGLSRVITDFDFATNTLTHAAFPAVVDAGDTYSIIGVETLTIGHNIKSYKVIRDLLPIKNNITVLGAPTAPNPRDRDGWSDDLGGGAGDEYSWTATAGTLSLDAVAPKAGTNWIRCLCDAGSNIAQFHVSIPRQTARNINKLRFWHTSGGTNDDARVRILAPDSSNYFECDDISQGIGPFWNDISLGESSEYDAAENPTGLWTKTGSPNWWAMEGIEFYFHFSSNGFYAHVDKVYFYPERWYHTASDLVGAGSSGVLYGQRDAEYTDENLLSDSECEKRAETLLTQLKDPVIRVDMDITPGTSNLKIGDRIPVTIPAENLTAVNCDVVSVSYDWEKNSGFSASCSMINSANTRALPPGNVNDIIRKHLTDLRSVTSEIYSRVVR